MDKGEKGGEGRALAPHRPSTAMSYHQQSPLPFTYYQSYCDVEDGQLR